MRKTYQCAIFAAVGLVLTAAEALSAQAQNQPRPLPPRQGVTAPRPAPNRAPPRTFQRAPAPRPALTAQPPIGDTVTQPSVESPLPVQIIQNPADTALTKEREAKTDKQDAELLAAQMRAADAAERQTLLGWFVALLAATGAGALIWNLIETRRANDIAQETVKLTQMQLRAHMILSTPTIDPPLTGQPVVARFNIKNVGQTPAHEVVVKAGLYFAASGEEDRGDLQEMMPGYRQVFAAGVESPVVARTQSTVPSGFVDGVAAKQNCIYFLGEVQYTDAFGNKRTTKGKFVYDWRNPRSKVFNLHSCQEGQTAT